MRSSSAGVATGRGTPSILTVRRPRRLPPRRGGPQPTPNQRHAALELELGAGGELELGGEPELGGALGAGASVGGPSTGGGRELGGGELELGGE